LKAHSLKVLHAGRLHVAKHQKADVVAPVILKRETLVNSQVMLPNPTVTPLGVAFGLKVTHQQIAVSVPTQQPFAVRRIVQTIVEAGQEEPAFRQVV
jgi:hypothetical protein